MMKEVSVCLLSCVKNTGGTLDYFPITTLQQLIQFITEALLLIVHFVALKQTRRVLCREYTKASYPLKKVCKPRRQNVTKINKSVIKIKYMISGFCRDGLLEPLKMGPIRCPETSVRNYPSILHNIPEERRY
jgi:hypothetical protein